MAKQNIDNYRIVVDHLRTKFFQIWIFQFQDICINKRRRWGHGDPQVEQKSFSLRASFGKNNRKFGQKGYRKCTAPLNLTSSYAHVRIQSLVHNFHFHSIPCQLLNNSNENVQVPFLISPSGNVHFIDICFLLYWKVNKAVQLFCLSILKEVFELGVFTPKNTNVYCSTLELKISKLYYLASTKP